MSLCEDERRILTREITSWLESYNVNGDPKCLHHAATRLALLMQKDARLQPTTITATRPDALVRPLAEAPEGLHPTHLDTFRRDIRISDPGGVLDEVIRNIQRETEIAKTRDRLKEEQRERQANCPHLEWRYAFRSFNTQWFRCTECRVLRSTDGTYPETEEEKA